MTPTPNQLDLSTLPETPVPIEEYFKAKRAYIEALRVEADYNCDPTSARLRAEALYLENDLRNAEFQYKVQMLQRAQQIVVPGVRQ